MVEGSENVDTGLETEGGGEGHWSDSHDEITSNADVDKYAKGYTSEAELAKAGHELSKKLGSSFRLPDDLKGLTEEQKATLFSRVKELRNVPETAEGYEITHAEGVEVNEDLESAFRAFAKERSYDNKDVNELVQWWDKLIGSMKEKQAEKIAMAASEAERDYRIKSGADFDKKMEGIKRLRALATAELGLGYQDEKTGEKHSKLDDALDATGLGNKVPILQLLSWIHEKFLAEGEPVVASGGADGLGGSFFDYKKVDK